MSNEWNIGYIATKRAQASRNDTAVIFEDEHYTYGRLNDSVNRCAHMLIKKGIQKGDRVALVLLNCMEFLEIYLAVAKLGAILVPLNWRLVGPELEYQLNDSGARMLVFHHDFLGSVDLIRNKLKVDHDKFIFLESLRKPIFGIESPEVPPCPEWAEDYHEITRDNSTDEPVIAYPVGLEDPLAIMYTSGATGEPKGTVVSHLQTYFKIFQIGTYTNGNQEDIVIAQMPLFHSGGLFIVATPVLFGGMPMVMRAGFDPNEFAEDIERYRGTIVFALTTMWRIILASGKLDQIDVSTVRFVGGGGERTPATLVEELAKRDLHLQQGFGLTENSAVTLLPREDIHRKMCSIGKPGFFTNAWIVDGKGRKLPAGEIGEIVCSGPCVMTGYWNRPEETAKVLVGGVLHTGDLGYADEEGYFYIVDRTKDMYRSGGENVYPAEVEKIITTLPKIAQAAIIGVPDKGWGETGMAFIVPAPNETVTEKEILDHLKGKVALYKFPTHFRFLSELPMTPTLKVRKAELKQKYGRVA